MQAGLDYLGATVIGRLLSSAYLDDVIICKEHLTRNIFWNRSTTSSQPRFTSLNLLIVFFTNNRMRFRFGVFSDSDANWLTLTECFRRQEEETLKAGNSIYGPLAHARRWLPFSVTKQLGLANFVLVSLYLWADIVSNFFPLSRTCLW